jgi:hypothetical protein
MIAANISSLFKLSKKIYIRYCPIIKINIKGILKYQISSYSILNKMEDTFSTRLKSIGKHKLTFRFNRKADSGYSDQEETSRKSKVCFSRGQY